MLPTLPGYVSAIRGRRPTALLDWRAADGQLEARTGQLGTFSRAGTATGLDSAGLTVTYRDHQLAWTDLGGRVALVLATAAPIAWTFPRSAQPGALTGYVACRHAGFGFTAGAGGFVALESAAGANPKWRILEDAGTNNGRLRTLHHNGTSSVTSTLGADVADATDCEYLVTLAATGAIQVTRVTAAGVTTVATASGTLATAAFSGDLLRIAAALALVRVTLASGIRTLDEMRELG